MILTKKYPASYCQFAHAVHCCLHEERITVVMFYSVVLRPFKGGLACDNL